MLYGYCIYVAAFPGRTVLNGIVECLIPIKLVDIVKQYGTVRGFFKARKTMQTSRFCFYQKLS